MSNMILFLIFVMHGALRPSRHGFIVTGRQPARLHGSYGANLRVVLPSHILQQMG